MTLVPTDPLGSGADHFIPGLAANNSPAGKLALAYSSYPDASCDPSSCQLEAALVTSTDGGANWTTPQLLAGPIDLSWLPPTTQGVMVGEYISSSLSGSTALPVYADAKAPTGGPARREVGSATRLRSPLPPRWRRMARCDRERELSQLRSRPTGYLQPQP